MLLKDISESDSFAHLNDSDSQLLCTLLTSWWDDYGKMIGDEVWIKGNIVRKLKQFTPQKIKKCLTNIAKHTDVEWWSDGNGNKWLYWAKFDKHQTISPDKKHHDKLPSPNNPQNSPGEARETPPQEEVEGEVEDKGKGKKITYIDYVKLTLGEYEKLVTKFGRKITKEYIERLNNYIGSKGKKYKSHYHTILAWANKDNIGERLAGEKEGRQWKKDRERWEKEGKDLPTKEQIEKFKAMAEKVGKKIPGLPQSEKEAGED